MQNQEDRKNVPVIIMDPGTWKIKIGFATDDLPTFEMPCIYIEKEMMNSKIVKVTKKNSYEYLHLYIQKMIHAYSNNVSIFISMHVYKIYTYIYTPTKT